MDDLTAPQPSDKFEAESTRLNKARFVEAVANSLAIGPTAKSLGISRSSIYRWMEEDPAFKAAVEEAREVAVDALEDSAYHRALRGDTALITFLLKHNRERYREQQATMQATIGTVRIEFDDKPPVEHAIAAPMPMVAIGAPTTIAESIAETIAETIEGEYTDAPINDDQTRPGE